MANWDNLSNADLAKKIEHTLLRPEASKEAIISLCEEALAHQFGAVCVNPNMVSTAMNVLKSTGISIACVANFPLGASTWSAVEQEVETALSHGASHLDLVLPLTEIVDQKHDLLIDKVHQIRSILSAPLILKCIVELSLLDQALWPNAVRVVKSTRADYFKTGTGFFGGVTPAMIRKLREIDSSLPIKASGGIQTRAQTLELLGAGADLLGSSRSVQILKTE